MATDVQKPYASASPAGKGLTAGSRGGVEAGQAAGIDEGQPGRKPPKLRSNSVLPIRGGKREMKAYAVTEEELENLGLLSIGASVSFSVASFLTAFCLSVWASISFSSDVPAEITAWWQGIATAAGGVAFALFLVGGFLLYRGHSKIGKIKNDTEH